MPMTIDQIIFACAPGTDPSTWPKLSCSEPNQLALRDASLSFPCGNDKTKWPKLSCSEPNQLALQDASLSVTKGNILFANAPSSRSGRMGVDDLGVWIEPNDANSGVRLNASPSAIGLYVSAGGTVGIGVPGPAAPEPSLHITRPNGDISLSSAALRIENPGAQSMQYFSFNADFHGGKSINIFLT